jgi:concanavalin A-like lectin/glucanase superfamily protein/PA14 domain-containing protein/immunoglobulin I-set domain protein
MKRFALMTLAICMALSTVSSADMLREIWWGDIPMDEAVALATGGTPADESEVLAEPFWDGIGDAYVAKCSGFLTIPAEGEYTFYVASDDDSQLFIDGEVVSFVEGWTGAQDWAAQASQASAPMALTEGQILEVYAVMREGAGGDNLGIGMTGPDYVDVTLLPAELTSVLHPTLAGDPVPADGATGVVDVVASWTAPGAVENPVYTVLAGDDPEALEVVAEGITETSLPYGSVPADLDPATTYYWQIVTNGAEGPIWSFTTSDGLPILNDTTGAFAAAGADVQLSVDVTSPLGAELTYQWKREKVVIMGMELFDVALPEGVAATLDIAAIDITDEGKYYCVVTNEYGTVTSPMVILDVQVGLIHRYTFNDSPDGVTIPDVVGGADGTLDNITGNAVIADGQLTLGNDGSQRSGAVDNTPDGDYVDLPNGMVSSLTQMTLMAWATYDDETLNVWSRVCSFGTSNSGEGTSSAGSNSGYFCIQPNRGGNNAGAETHQQGSGTNRSIVLDGRMPVGEEILYTYVQDDAAGRGRFYINGALQGTMVTSDIMTLQSLTDNNCWLGRAQWNDPLHTGSFNEFRLYDTVLSAEEIMASYLTGPDELPVIAEDCGDRLGGDRNRDCVLDIVDIAMAADQYLRESFEKDQTE